MAGAPQRPRGGRWQRKAAHEVVAADGGSAGGGGGGGQALEDEGFWDEAPTEPSMPASGSTSQAAVRAGGRVAPEPVAPVAARGQSSQVTSAELEAVREEERATLDAIYGLEFEVLGPSEWRIDLASPANAPPAAVRILLPEGYPMGQDPPVPILECECHDEGFQAVASSVFADLLGQWEPVSEGCIFQWVEQLRGALQPALEEVASVAVARLVERDELLAAAVAEAESIAEAARPSGGGGFTFLPANPQYGQRRRHFEELSFDTANAVEIRHGEPIVDRKSTFIAHAARVANEGQVQWALREMLSDKKVAVATHNIFAYKYMDEARGVQVADNDDDGEDGAGSKLAQLLSMAGCEGVLVMVSRWYGGIQLGADRFKHINRSASLLLDDAGWSCRGSKASAGGGRSKK